MVLLNEFRIDQVIQFALAAAGREDDTRLRQLGPIHLVKYVYVADLAQAQAHGGEVFTGALWRFHHYGPWAVEVFQRIEPAAQAVGATRRTFSSPRYDTDVVRYSVEDDVLFDRLERSLPWPVVSALRRAVHEHGADTESLLRHVYTTAPMLRAAPGEMLDFSPQGPEGAPTHDMPETAQDVSSKLLADTQPRRRDFEAVTTAVDWSPRRAQREKRRALANLRERVRARLAERLARPKHPASPPPRYDEVFREGARWLDKLAGPPPLEGEAEAVFSDKVWKSPTRGGRDLP